MREILFRGKTGFGAWVHGDLIHRQVWKSKFEVIRIDDSGFDNYTEYEVATETIGQYTGLTDKNGKKIFEGDIVRCISMTDMANMVVIFEDGEFRMVLCEKYKNYIPGCGFYAIRCFDKEVIGNIHDNPELLENS